MLWLLYFAFGFLLGLIVVVRAEALAEGGMPGYLARRVIAINTIMWPVMFFRSWWVASTLIEED